MEIIEKIEEIMRIKGISAYNLERNDIVKQTTFQGWKRGSQPTADKLLKIISYLEVSPNELFGYEEIIQLTNNDKEMLLLFQQLPEREQFKYIARLEDAVEIVKQNEGKSSNTRIG